MGYFEDWKRQLARSNALVGMRSPVPTAQGATLAAESRALSNINPLELMRMDQQGGQFAQQLSLQGRGQNLQAISGERNRILQGTTLGASLIGEKGRGLALGETEQARAGFSRLIDQGGILSQAQISGQARREAGQIGAGIESQKGQLAGAFAAQGISNPAAVAAGSAGLRASSLGAGARRLASGETENARSLAGLLGGAAQLGMSRAGLQARTSFEQAKARGPLGVQGDIESQQRRREQERRNERIMESFRKMIKSR